VPVFDWRITRKACSRGGMSRLATLSLHVSGIARDVIDRPQGMLVRTE
jgi:hypothetical protein